jgi:hypothetical protein
MWFVFLSVSIHKSHNSSQFATAAKMETLAACTV